MTWLQSLDSTTLATWVIALATIVNIFIYWQVSHQTRELFVVSNRPAIAIDIERGQYAVPDLRFTAQMVAKNHGTVTATDLSIRLAMAPHLERQIGPLVVHANGTHTESVTMELGLNSYRQGNAFEALLEFSYKGVGERLYRHTEKQSYDYQTYRFVPFWSNESQEYDRIARRLRRFAAAMGS
jgi:hypothetical protein